MPHMMMVMMVMMAARPSVVHRTEGGSHPHSPAAKAAERIDPGAIVPVIRAGKEPDDR